MSKVMVVIKQNNPIKENIIIRKCIGWQITSDGLVINYNSRPGNNTQNSKSMFVPLQNILYVEDVDD